MEARVLLTGGTGFVGINIAQSLVERGCQVVICSKRPMLKEAADALGENVVWMQGDVLNRERLDEIMQQACIKHVVHAAAITPNAEREKADMGSVIEVNCLGTLRVMEAAYKAGLQAMAELISRMEGVSHKEALAIFSVSGDLCITQIVNGVRGVHALLPYSELGPVQYK